MGNAAVSAKPSAGLQARRRRVRRADAGPRPRSCTGECGPSGRLGSHAPCRPPGGPSCTSSSLHTGAHPHAVPGRVGRALPRPSPSSQRDAFDSFVIGPANTSSSWRLIRSPPTRNAEACHCAPGAATSVECRKPRHVPNPAAARSDPLSARRAIDPGAWPSRGSDGLRCGRRSLGGDGGVSRETSRRGRTGARLPDLRFATKTVIPRQRRPSSDPRLDLTQTLPSVSACPTRCRCSVIDVGCAIGPGARMFTSNMGAARRRQTPACCRDRPLEIAQRPIHPNQCVIGNNGMPLKAVRAPQFGLSKLKRASRTLPIDRRSEVRIGSPGPLTGRPRTYLPDRPGLRRGSHTRSHWLQPCAHRPGRSTLARRGGATRTHGSAATGARQGYPTRVPSRLHRLSTVWSGPRNP